MMDMLADTDSDPQAASGGLWPGSPPINSCDSTQDLIRVEGKRREEKRREDSFLDCPPTDDADFVGDNAVSPVERQISLYHHPVVTS